MKRQHLTSFYLEALLLVSIFVAMILVLTGVFGAAHTQSVEAKRLSRAVTLAANAAEAVAGADSLDRAAELLDESGNVRIEDGLLTADYDSDGRPCSDGVPALRLTASWEPAADGLSLVTSRISVFVPGREGAVYTIETARYGKGAAA